MAEMTTSADGTPIAYDAVGEGPPLILVRGALNDRRTPAALAELLAESFWVYSYDRRGRGDSGNTLPYAVEREIDDLEAMIEAAGGSAALYGHSSGAQFPDVQYRTLEGQDHAAAPEAVAPVLEKFLA